MPEFNVDRARFNMVEQQIRPWDVLDSHVLDALGAIPREKFVPPTYRNLAFADFEIPVGHGQKMLPPKLQAKMLQALAIRPGDMVLEVGAGTGFFTALLARFAKHVYSVEIQPELLETARQNLSKMKISNVTLEQGDAAKGWGRHGPYDGIAITGSVSEISPEFLKSLRSGGRLFAVVGKPPVMHARLVTRSGEHYPKEDLFETVIPPLQDVNLKPVFLF
ncbi:protein-L-isoaspartate(D-aspartate) O-methyltransferase [Gammaproteobacteria bacterium]